MRYSSGRFLSSRLGRRMFAMFCACAIVPVAALALVSYWNTSSSLRDNSRARLQQATKSFGMSLLERLMFARSELRMLDRQLAAGTMLAELEQDVHDGFEGSQRRFLGIAQWRDGEVVARAGTAFEHRALLDGELQRLAAGDALVTFPASGDAGQLTAVVWEATADDTLLSGWVNPEYGWGDALQVGLSEGTHLIILTPEERVLGSSLEASTTREVLQRIGAQVGALRRFEVETAAGSFFGGRWELPLSYEFGHHGLTLLALEDDALVMATANGFGRSYALLGLTAIWVVMLLSISQIRRNLVPLEKLKAATERVAVRDFKHKVEVVSGDEFQDLAESFNAMTGRIDSQFAHLATLASIERGILSSLELEQIVGKTIRILERTYPGSHTSIRLVSQQDATARIYFPGKGDELEIRAGCHDPAAAQPNESGYTVYESSQRWPSDAEVLRKRGARGCLEFPFAIDDRPAGALLVACEGELPDTDDRAQLRQIASQLAVALANARLVNELDGMMQGALTALARAVDAKSAWTKGHSERVTRLAVRLGVELGLPEADTERLHRGGLLHDIGKIGVPNAILDKPGPLSDEEYTVIKTHPTIGARILEPIRAFADVLPIVEQHHERVDGKGYPSGLTGEEMHPLARITVVADVFDACSSARPYRAGMPLAKVVGIICEGRGSHFDPLAVDAFESVVAAEAEFFKALKAA